MGLPPPPHVVRLRRARPPVRWAGLAAIWLHLLGVLVLGLADHASRDRAWVRLTRTAPTTPEDAPSTGRDGRPKPSPPLRVERLLPSTPVVTPAALADRRVIHVPVDQAEAPPASPDAPDAARDARSPRTTRRVNTARDEGRPTPRTAGRSDADGRPTADHRDGVAEARAGDRTPADGEARVASGGHGGGLGEAVGGGAPPELGPRLPGGRPSPAGGEAVAGTAAPTASRPDAVAPGAWSPFVTRIAIVRSARSSRPSPTEGDARAVETRHARSADRGAAPSWSQTNEADLPDAPTREPPGARRARVPPALGDPVTALRTSLGWEGPGARDRPLAAAVGRAAGHGRAHASPRVADDSARIDWLDAVDARGTALGRYIAEVERLVDSRWRDLDLPTHERGVGRQGQVAVQYVIRRSGRVDAVKVVRSSGVPSLDRMAVEAVPARLPRFPRELREPEVLHQIVLRYRNPLVGP